MNSLVEIGTVVLEKMDFKRCQYILTISLTSSLGKGRCPSFVKIWIPFTKWCFVASLVENGTEVLKILNQCCQCTCSYACLLMSALAKGFSPLFEQTWFTFTQGCFVQSLFEIGTVSLEKSFKCHFILLFCQYLPLEMDVFLQLNNFELPSPEDV